MEIGKIAHWAGRLLKKKAVAEVVIAAATPVACQDEIRYLSGWHRFEAVRTSGQTVQMKTQAMSSHSMVFRSERELNLGEVLTVEVEGMSIPATVTYVDNSKRFFAGELELTATPKQRAGLLELLASWQVPRAIPAEPCTSLVVASPTARKTLSGDKTRSRRLQSGTRPIRRSATGSRKALQVGLHPSI